jgi:hypothetical protein
VSVQKGVLTIKGESKKEHEVDEKNYYRTFITYNIIGGVIWAVGVTLGGYFLGSLIPADKIDKYLLPIIMAIIVFSLLPAVKHILDEKRSKKKTDVDPAEHLILP